MTTRLEVLVVGGQAVKGLLQQDVLVGHVGEDEGDLRPVLRVAQHLLHDLQHGRDAAAARNLRARPRRTHPRHAASHTGMHMPHAGTAQSAGKQGAVAKGLTDMRMKLEGNGSPCRCSASCWLRT